MLRNTTITGGDTGAHVWFPDFLIDHFLPWRVAGWSNDFYAGFPAGQFYFPFPAVLIALLDVVLPYNIAFKLVTVLGPLALPAGAYVFARGIRAPRPTAPMLALAATGFLFFKDGGDSTMTFDFHIMGGNLPSTLAGEFSFMIAVALALFFLGTLASALDRRGPLWLPAVFLALTFTSHVVVAIFAVYAGVVIWLVIHPLRNFTRIAAIGVVGVLLTAFWFVPLAANLGNTTDMRYEPIGIGAGLPHYLDWMFISQSWFIYPLALIAARVRDLVPTPVDADRRRDHGHERARLLQLGGAARDLREGTGVEPAPPAVLDADALPARRHRCRRARAPPRARHHVAHPGWSRQGWSRHEGRCVDRDVAGDVRHLRRGRPTRPAVAVRRSRLRHRVTRSRRVTDRRPTDGTALGPRALEDLEPDPASRRAPDRDDGARRHRRDDLLPVHAERP